MEETMWKGKFVRVTTEKMDDLVWERAYIPDGVVIFPVTDDGKILMIRERRPHETPSVRLKAISGVLDDGEAPIVSAQRELREEVGYRSDDLVEFWHYATSGTVNANTHFFLAKQLKESKLPNPDGESTIEEVIAMTPAELTAKIEAEEIRWGVGVMGWFKLQLLLRDGKLTL